MKKKLADLLKLIQEYSDAPWIGSDATTKDKNKLGEKVWAMISEMDREAGEGLAVGRNIRFQVADGYANYIITKVNKETVSVEHLPIDDAWHFQGVYNGKLMRGVAEQNIRMHDGFMKIFAKNA